MGLLSKKAATSDVSFAGIQAYAESGHADVTISAEVVIERKRLLGGKEPLPMLGSLGAVTLLTMLRREPHYVIPFMTLVHAMSEELMDGGVDAAEFSSRGCVVTDPDLLNAMVGGASEFGSLGADSVNAAGLNTSLPLVADTLTGPVERTTQLILKEGRNGLGYVRFKFGMGLANALTTIGAWTATVDALVRSAPRGQMAMPIGAGLKALEAVWENADYPNGISVQEAAEFDFLVTDVTASHTPD